MHTHTHATHACWLIHIGYRTIPNIYDVPLYKYDEARRTKIHICEHSSSSFLLWYSVVLIIITIYHSTVWVFSVFHVFLLRPTERAMPSSISFSSFLRKSVSWPVSFGNTIQCCYRLQRNEWRATRKKKTKIDGKWKCTEDESRTFFSLFRFCSFLHSFLFSFLNERLSA